MCLVAVTQQRLALVRSIHAVTSHAASRPARQVCKLCGYDDDVHVRTLAPGLWELHCSACNYVWPSDTAVLDDERGGADGVAASYGLYEDLLKCLVSREPYVEYGIVEYRYADLRPALYAELLDRYGHTRNGRQHYTVSSFLGATLGWLRDHDEIVMRFGPATGYWSYNGTIGYCALPPGPADGSMLSYTAFAESIGINPDA